MPPESLMRRGAALTQQHQIISLVRLKLERDRRESAISKKKQSQANKKQEGEMKVITQGIVDDVRHVFGDPFIPDPDEEAWQEWKDCGKPTDDKMYVKISNREDMSPRTRRKWDAQQV